MPAVADLEGAWISSQGAWFAGVGDVSSLRGAALRFVLNSNLVSCAVLGPRSCLQLDQLVREAGKQPYLTPNAVTALAARLREAGVEA